MACCTTIPPLNPSQKRKSGGIFDLPRSAKHRRPVTSTLTTTSPFLTSTSSQSSTMFTTSSSLNNKPIFADNDSGKHKPSAFHTNNAYSPLGSLWTTESPNNTNNTNQDSTGGNNESQFKNELMERIRHEAKRLIKRKQIAISKTQSSSIEPAGPPQTEGPAKKTQPDNNHSDIPIFSMNQVNMICERMLGERENALREQYDKILSEKMSEQYDSFVKFTHEQIQRRFESSQCSYVS